MQSVPNAHPNVGAARDTQVRQIFSAIAPQYDLLNHVLSLNIDRFWRKKAVDELRWEEVADGAFLDACAGTFDLALELSGRTSFKGRVVASDFAYAMLVHGRAKLAEVAVSPVCGDSLNLPFPDGQFDGVTVGFGARNLSDLRGGLSDFRRVLKPGRRLVVLEFMIPPNPIMRAVYLFYFQNILPVVGRLISGHPWAYTYLPESVKEFPGPEEFGALLESVGFTDVGWTSMSGGIAGIHWGSA